MIEIGPYPVETGLFPTHFIVALMTALIFFLILTVKYNYKELVKIPRLGKSNDAGQPEQKPKDENEKLDPQNIAAIGTLVFGIVTLVVTPYTQIPLLDYKVSGPFPTERVELSYLRVDIINSGIDEAKNVLLSFHAPGVTFRGYETQPYLPKNDTYGIRGNNQTGDAFLRISLLPPRSTTTVFESISMENPIEKQKLTTYLRSDETVAYFNVFGIILFYVVLSAIYGVTACIFWFNKSKRKIIALIAGILIAIVMFLGPYLHDCTFNYNKC